MRPHLRNAFNAAYSDERYERYSATLRASLGCDVGYRLAETPAFFTRELATRCETAAREIVAQLARPAAREASRTAVPERFAVDDGSVLPQFAVVDFAIAVDADGALAPRLVELQGFPSLLAFQVLQSDAWLHELETVPHVPAGLSPWFGALDRTSFLALARRAIVGDADPAETVLFDIDPPAQKTYCDFAATEKLFGVVACDPRAAYVRGGRLYRRDAVGRERRIARVYNRVVGDDLVRDGESVLPFDLRDDVAVSWAPHPRWFWAWSKASLPALEHPAVPRTQLVSTLDAVPDRLSDDFVLKPLFSFAGSGVNVHPTEADVRAISLTERDGWCLQRKIDYAPALRAVDGGGVKLEIRVMLLRPDDADELVPATNLVRLSRGEMIGVDFNRDRTWVGSSVGLWLATDG